MPNIYIVVIETDAEGGYPGNQSPYISTKIGAAYLNEIEADIEADYLTHASSFTRAYVVERQIDTLDGFNL